MLSFKMAIRFLVYGRTQTILIVIGIAVAISIQVFVGLLIDSLQRTLVDRTIGNTSQITITSATDSSTIRSWQNIVSDIEQMGIVRAISASASANAFVQDENRSLPILVRGFNFDAADRIWNISDAIYEGSAYRSKREVLLGKDLREELEVNLGDRLVVITPNGSTNTLTISGFYDLGVSSINKTWVITYLDTVQRIFDLGDRVTSIEMKIDDVFQADVMANEIQQELDNEDIKIENWKEQNQELLSGLEGQETSSTIIQVVIILSVIIAISSVLALSALQKSREIGILKAMGIKDRAASLIFIYQGFLLGLVGSVIGVALGLGLIYAFINFTTSPDGIKLVDLYIGYDFIIRSWLIALLASTLAGVIPARKSLTLNPIDVIKEV